MSVFVRRFWVPILFIVAGCGPRQSVHEATGKVLYELHCAQCHDVSPPDLLTKPPSLVGLFNSRTLPSGASATDSQVRGAIVDGLRTMPAFNGRLSEEQIRYLIAYLHTLK